MLLLGSFTPGFNFLIAASFQVEISPRRILLAVFVFNFREVTPGTLNAKAIGPAVTGTKV